MKLKGMKLRNYGKFTDFEIEFNDGVTRLVGVNGAGKTTVGNSAIVAGLKGISEKAGADGCLVGERFRFIGPAKSTADTELIFIDESKGNAEIVVKNKISKTGNSITFKGPEGYEMGPDWLKNLLSVAFMSAKNFSQVDSKTQALMLGINTETFDKEIADLKVEATGLNRELKNFGEVTVPPEVKKVSVDDLLAEREKMDAFNKTQQEKRDAIDTNLRLREEIEADKNRVAQEVADLEEQIKTKKAGIDELQARIQKGQDLFQELKEPEEDKDTSLVAENISKAGKTNEDALAYEAAKTKKTNKEAKRKECDANKDKQETKAGERLTYIKNFEFGMDGLDVDDKGGLLMDNKPIKEAYFSKGELEVMVAKLAVSTNPTLKLRFIDDLESLDEENQEIIINDLLAQGFQIITAEVGKEKTADNDILLRECKVVKDEAGEHHE